FYAQRVSPTRYIFLFPLFGPYRNVREKQIATADEIQRAAPAAAVYVPNDLFFNPGSDQYFTDWSLSYLEQNFYPDTWLIKESPTVAELVRAEPDSSAPAEGMLGALLVKPGNRQLPDKNFIMKSLMPRVYGSLRANWPSVTVAVLGLAMLL